MPENRGEKLLQELYENLLAAEKQLIMAKTRGEEIEKAQLSVAVAKSAIVDISAKKAVDKYTVWKSMMYEFNERVGHLLAVRTRQKMMQGEIREIRDPQSGMISDPAEIRSSFKKHYLQLYTEENRQVGQEINEYLEGMSQEGLTIDEQELLEHPITGEEVMAIQSVPAGKAAGTDLIPGEFYKVFASRLQTLMVEVFFKSTVTGRGTRVELRPI